MKPDQFSKVFGELSQACETGTALHDPFVEYFPINGAAISTLGALLGTETISASDSKAARLDELQFDLGEGPCWEAMATASTVSEPDLLSAPSRRWPAFEEAIVREDVAAIFALPMVIGSLRIGAIDLYCERPGELGSQSLQQGQLMAGVVARHILKNSLQRVGREYADDPPSPLSRRVIHQATGIVLAQMQLSAADARLVIEGHAFATGRPVMEVAQRIVDRDLVLDQSNGDSHD